jgi:hypothetical protein
MGVHMRCTRTGWDHHGLCAADGLRLEGAVRKYDTPGYRAKRSWIWLIFWWMPDGVEQSYVLKIVASLVVQQEL